MNPPPRKRKKATSATSGNPESPNSDIAPSKNPASAIIDVSAVEVPELTPEEQSDRLHLERKVERAFFEAGKALAELRDRLARIYSDSLEETVNNLLQSLGKLNRPYLTGVEEKLLSVLEKEFKVSD